MTGSAVALKSIASSRNNSIFDIYIYIYDDDMIYSNKKESNLLKLTFWTCLAKTRKKEHLKAKESNVKSKCRNDLPGT